MLHLLHNLPNNEGLCFDQLDAAGIKCEPDTIRPLETGGVIEIKNGVCYITEPASTILNNCVVANDKQGGELMWVDLPIAFVVMPFSEPWSDSVYLKMIKPAIEQSGFESKRGDAPIRVGDLTGTIWNALMEAGLIIADVSSANLNVFYEIGLAHSLGKDVYILKQKDSIVPADFSGIHYYSYELSNLEEGQMMLIKAISEWSKRNSVDGVRKIYPKS